MKRKLFPGSPPETITHEQHILAVRHLAAARLNEEDRAQLLKAKLVYGSGGGRAVRGQCFHDAWRDTEATSLIEVCAFGEESPVQLAGTTLHELAHCLAGRAAGHGKAWRDRCRALGLVRCSATGQAYGPKDFAPELWDELTRLTLPSDGGPVRKAVTVVISGPAILNSPAKCTAGYGARGGESRGPGSGSRLRLYLCACGSPKVRVASDHFNAYCGVCNARFELVKPADLGDL